MSCIKTNTNSLNVRFPFGLSGTRYRSSANFVIQEYFFFTLCNAKQKYRETTPQLESTLLITVVLIIVSALRRPRLECDRTDVILRHWDSNYVHLLIPMNTKVEAITDVTVIRRTDSNDKVNCLLVCKQYMLQANASTAWRLSECQAVVT